MSLFAFLSKVPTLKCDTKIYNSRFELQKQANKSNAGFHSFVSNFRVLGYQISRVSIFEIPLGAEIDLKTCHENKIENRFRLTMNRTRPRGGNKFFISVKSMSPMSVLAAKEFTSALENTLLNSGKNHRHASVLGEPQS